MIVMDWLLLVIANSDKKGLNIFLTIDKYFCHFIEDCTVVILSKELFFKAQHTPYFKKKFNKWLKTLISLYFIIIFIKWFTSLLFNKLSFQDKAKIWKSYVHTH